MSASSSASAEDEEEDFESALDEELDENARNDWPCNEVAKTLEEDLKAPLVGLKSVVEAKEDEVEANRRGCAFVLVDRNTTDEAVAVALDGCCANTRLVASLSDIAADLSLLNMKDELTMIEEGGGAGKGQN